MRRPDCPGMEVTTIRDLRFTTPRHVQYGDDRASPTGCRVMKIAGKAMIDE